MKPCITRELPKRSLVFSAFCAITLLLSQTPTFAAISKKDRIIHAPSSTLTPQNKTRRLAQGKNIVIPGMAPLPKIYRVFRIRTRPSRLRVKAKVNGQSIRCAPRGRTPCKVRVVHPKTARLTVQIRYKGKWQTFTKNVTGRSRKTSNWSITPQKNKSAKKGSSGIYLPPLALPPKKPVAKPKPRVLPRTTPKPVVRRPAPKPIERVPVRTVPIRKAPVRRIPVRPIPRPVKGPDVSKTKKQTTPAVPPPPRKSNTMVYVGVALGVVAATGITVGIVMATSTAGRVGFKCSNPLCD